MSNEIKTKIRLLKGARRSLLRYRDDYICHALINICTHKYDYRVVEQLSTYIMCALNGSSHYNIWYCNTYHTYLTHAQARKNRIAWVSWMINCLEEDLANENA